MEYVNEQLSTIIKEKLGWEAENDQYSIDFLVRQIEENVDLDVVLDDQAQIEITQQNEGWTARAFVSGDYINGEYQTTAADAVASLIIALESKGIL